MLTTSRAGAICLAAVLTPLVASAHASAAKKITGKLSQPHFTVIAIDKDGEAASKQSKPNGKFKLQPPAKRVSLHLRAADGTYAGPVVIDKKGKSGRKAIVGVEAGAELGKVKVRDGYAKLKQELNPGDVDRTREARATKGVPIGAGNFGRVASRATGTPGPGSDQDRDGIVGALDVDDDGDLVLDNLDQSSVARGAPARQGCGPDNFYCQPIASSLALANFEQTVNVNAGSTLGEIDEAPRSFGALRFSPLSDSAELDCGGEPDPGYPDGWIGGLRYCTRGGTGIASAGGSGPPFPGPPGGQFDPDGDGFGTFPKPSFLAPRATTADIKTGDVMIQRVTNADGTETLVPATLNFVFVTVPALVSYSDTAGNCAKVSGTPGTCATEFSYPVPPGGPGTFGNGFPVSAPGGEDVVVTLTFWRPQRQPILDSDPVGAQWMDIGHLTYAALAQGIGGGGCSQTTLSTNDPNLTTPSLPLLGTGGLADLKDDEVSSPANIFTYQLNLSQCLAEHGISFNSGEEQQLTFRAVAGATDFAHQSVWFARQ